MKQPIFVTGSQNKADYVSRLLGVTIEHKKLDLEELQTMDAKKIVEHKVRQAYDIIKQPVLVEDVSLMMNALDGLPGPFAKFFVDAKNGVEIMCRMLDGFEDRSAYVLTYFAYYDGQHLEIIEGRLDGVISDSPRGTNGFGYDVIFEPVGYGGKTRAELSEDDDAKTYRQAKNFDDLKRFLLA